jgi:hypothetical protein
LDLLSIEKAWLKGGWALPAWLNKWFYCKASMAITFVGG